MIQETKRIIITETGTTGLVIGGLAPFQVTLMKKRIEWVREGRSRIRKIEREKREASRRTWIISG